MRDQYDLATTLDERRRIALAIIDLEDRARLEALRLIQLDKDIYDAKTRRLAAIEEARIIESRPAREEQVRRSNQGPLDRYIEGTRDTKTRVEEAMVRELQSVNDGITDALSKQLGIKNQFVKDMFSMFLEDVIFRPLAEALRNKQAGGGGLFSSLLSLGTTLFGGSSGAPPGTAGGMDLRGFGRASGGYVGPGQAVRVNEHKGTGVELLRMGAQGGTVIPLGQVNQRVAQPATQGGGVTTVRLELSGDIDARIQQQSAGVAIEVVRATAEQISDLGAQKALKQMSTPRM